MRERLVGSFVLFAVLIAVIFGVVRAYALTELVKQSEASKLDRSVVLMAALIGGREDGGRVLDTRNSGNTSIVVNALNIPIWTASRWWQRPRLMSLGQPGAICRAA